MGFHRDLLGIMKKGGYTWPPFLIRVAYLLNCEFAYFAACRATTADSFLTLRQTRIARNANGIGCSLEPLSHGFAILTEISDP